MALEVDQEMEMQSPLVSIIAPTWNNADDLILCLSSIQGLDYPKHSLEVIVWDNDSAPGARERIRKTLDEMRRDNYRNLTLIESDENLGVYTSRDELCKRVDKEAQFVLSLDDDVVLPEGSLADMLRLFEQFPDVGIVGPRIVYCDCPDEIQHGAGLVNLWLGTYREVRPPDTIECDYVIGCCQLIRKEVVDHLQGFDRDYYTSHAEVDFCLKAKKRGYRVMYQPEVVVKHRVERGGTRTLERLYYLYRNKILVMKKNASMPQKITSLGICYILGPLKAVLNSILFNRSINLSELKMIFKAFLHGIVNRRGKRVDVP